MKLNIIYSGMGMGSLSDKPAWQQEAEDELFDMIRASGITLELQYFIDEPCSMTYIERSDLSCSWVHHISVTELKNTTPQNVFATLIFWQPKETECSRYYGMAYGTNETGFKYRPVSVISTLLPQQRKCNLNTLDFQCLYSYVIGHEFYHLLEYWVKQKLLLATSNEMPYGDDEKLCNSIGLCQGTNPITERWETKGSKPCYQCFFDLYLPEVDRLINEHDYVEPEPEPEPEPTKNNTWLWIAGFGLAAAIILSNKK